MTRSCAVFTTPNCIETYSSMYCARMRAVEISLATWFKCPGNLKSSDAQKRERKCAFSASGVTLAENNLSPCPEASARPAAASPCLPQARPSRQATAQSRLRPAVPRSAFFPLSGVCLQMFQQANRQCRKNRHACESLKSLFRFGVMRLRRE